MLRDPQRIGLQLNDSDASYMIKHLNIPTSSQGMHEFTAQVEQLVRESGVKEGLCTLFVRHTSTSLLVQENADPSAKRDLDRWLNRLVPENDGLGVTIKLARASREFHVPGGMSSSAWMRRTI